MSEGAVSGGLPLLLRTIYLEVWFAVFAVAGTERWKGVIYARVGYRADLQMDMDKTSSAYHVQRTTALMVAILNAAAATELWGTKRSGREKNTSWVQKRRHNLGPSHARAVINYQNNLLVIAICHSAAAEFVIALQQVFVTELGLQLGKKLEAVRPFAPSADFIDVHFDA